MKKITLLSIIIISLKSFAQNTPCIWQDGHYRYYVRLITNEIPTSDFNNVDFINHLITNSNPTSPELDFLNNSITEVTQSFPSSQVESSQKLVTVVSEYDSMNTFLIAYTESIDLVEFECEAELGIDDFTSKNGIKIYPNPVSENSYIQIDKNSDIKSLKIFDITGKLIYSKGIEKLNLIEFRQFKLIDGIYFLTFISDNLKISKKIIYKQL